MEGDLFPAHLKGKTVVLAEDSRSTAVLLKAVLEKYFGAREVITIETFNATELAIRQNGSVGLYILDINLDDARRTGLELAKLIRKSYNTPILFITADELQETIRDEIGRMSNVQFEFKPVTLKSLNRILPRFRYSQTDGGI